MTEVVPPGDLGRGGLIRSWPLFGLRIRTARLELRSPTDDDLVDLLAVARAGIHDPEIMPFGVAWTDLEGGEFDQGFLQFYWAARASWTPEAWSLPLAVVVDGRPVGVQEVRARSFPVLRAVETGSWLGREWQGRGIGTEMRAAVLHFAFDGLGAVEARSGALHGNDVSRRVSEKLGYQPNGEDVVAPRGTPVRQQRYLLRRADWRPDRWPARIQGLGRCRHLFGLPPGAGGLDD